VTGEERRRLAALKEPYFDEQMLHERYGFRLLNDTALSGAFRLWGSRIRWRRPLFNQGGAHVDHYALETFFQGARLLPKRWAAARLGMEEESLEDVMGVFRSEDPILLREPTSPNVVSEDFLDRITRYFPELANTIFADHDDMCSQVHEVLRTAEPFKIEVKPLLCVTSEALNEDPPNFAWEFDAITLDPIGLRYNVWLNLGKPMNLRPDACSLRFYAREREALEPFMMGSPPSIPEPLLGQPSA
jgi:hypothetical protein